jgi:hypothetical protein
VFHMDVQEGEGEGVWRVSGGCAQRRTTHPLTCALALTYMSRSRALVTPLLTFLRSLSQIETLLDRPPLRKMQLAASSPAIKGLRPLQRTAAPCPLRIKNASARATSFVPRVAAIEMPAVEERQFARKPVRTFRHRTEPSARQRRA